MRALVVILLLASCALAQSRRVGPESATVALTSDPTAGRSAKDLFDEANAYNRKKFAEFDQKKVAVSEALIQQTYRERKQLAAKYAAAVGKRTELTADDLYYLGMLHWVADNGDAAREAFEIYLTKSDLPPEKSQDARAIDAVLLARQKQFDAATKMLAEYLKGTPVRPSQIGQIEKELSAGLTKAGDLAGGAQHADAAYSAYKTIAAEPGQREKTIDSLIESGFSLFKLYRDLAQQPKADATLENMRKTGIELQSGSLWFYSVDSQITYQIDTGRKPQALANYKTALTEADKIFASKTTQTQVLEKLKAREKQYSVLGETAPALSDLEPSAGEISSLADLRGKVVLLDFWATWCGPCVEAFPAMQEWKSDFGPQGFVILGLTRYYGLAAGMPADRDSELKYVKDFAASHGVSYDLLMAKDETNHLAYGAAGIPTVALIDRKGVVRYLESGTSQYRLDEMREIIAKLVAEK
ncbi:MAG TPA: TlpA disulfide reductase family protein [Pyrinomonadaceae bacterium]